MTGVGLLAAAEGTIQVAALEPIIMTDATTMSTVVGAVTEAVTNTVIATQVAVGIFPTGSFTNGNGGFETGDFTGFVASGEVAIITSLGPLTPPEGQFMAFLSTGGAAVNLTTSTVTTEPFDLAAGVDTISFDFNFLSNEFPVFVGTGVNDTLEATISGAQTEQTFLLADVDSSTFIAIQP